jgi:type II secretory pathway component PulF
MANFSYQAINESGTTISGMIQADTPEMAQNLLLSKGKNRAGPRPCQDH